MDDKVYLVWEQLLHALYLDNQQAGLRQEAERALDIFPNRPYLYFYAGLGAAARGDFTTAQELLQQAELIFGAAKLEAAGVSRRYREAFNAVAEGKSPSTTALPAPTTEPWPAYLQARQAQEKGDHQAVLQLLEPHDQPRNTFALQLELLGDASLNLGRKEQAAQYYQRALAAGSKSKSLTNKLTQSRS
ncbi:MAG: hypothetical protein HC821_01990 [Lewinella sp.]|nr:hypothetical protein [Lewinella sp.]